MRNDQSVSCELEGERVQQQQGGHYPGIIRNYLLERVIQLHGSRDVASIPSYALDKQRREMVERGWQRGLEIIKADHELMRSRVIKAEKQLQ